MPFTPAQKRQQRLEATHGDAIRKLPKGTQREIRELVNQNRGRDARTLLSEADSERRLRERVRSKLRRIMDKPASQRKGTNPFKGASDAEITMLRILYDGKAA